MIEKVFKMTVGNEKVIEKVIMDENINYIHMIFNEKDGLPEHHSNATLYMTVLRGVLSIGLGDQAVEQYEMGTIVKIPVNTKMNVKNLNREVLELIVIKAPAPTN